MSSAGGKQSSPELGVRAQGHLQELWINLLERFFCIFVLKDLHCKQAKLNGRKLNPTTTKQFWAVPIYQGDLACSDNTASIISSPVKCF